MTNNEKGLSLVEVLAGLVLLSIISTLTTMILINVFKSNDTAAEEISIKQNANVMMSEFQRQYYETADTTLCFNPPAGLSIDKKTTVDNGGAPIEMDENYCVHDVVRKEPLNVDLYVKGNNSNKQLALKTTLVKGGQQKLTNTDTVPDAPCPTKRPIDYIDLTKQKDSSLPCNATGNYIWNGKSSCQKPPKIDGNLYITDEFEKDNYNLNVTGTVTFQNEVDLDKHSTLTIGKNACFNDETQFDDSTITVGGSSIFANEFDMDNSNMNIVGNAQFYREFDVDDSEVTIGGNAEYFNEFDVEDGNIRISGTAVFHKEFDFEGEDQDGDNDQSKYLVSIGNGATFKDEFDFDDGTLKIIGSAEFSSKADFDETFVNIGGLSSFLGEADFEKSTAALGSAFFNSKVEIGKTSMTVAKDLTSKSVEFKIKDKSSLHVLGTSTFSKRPELSDDSTICLKSDPASSSRSCPN
ncbi:type II secretion system protein [Aciduricibacillus chroicocephali]|uniref:Type II secretion system protein n=1 Tax=Aciduricibacillus chroicocephali TaxID=3054939 RepID=A0ABY9KWP1_9BACI|nr:type II secretion system protein [Bacillaceae bacterium 44XB]